MSLSSLQGGVRQVLDAEANTMFLSQKRAFSAMAQESRRAWKEDKRSLQELMIKNSMSTSHYFVLPLHGFSRMISTGGLSCEGCRIPISVLSFLPRQPLGAQKERFN